MNVMTKLLLAIGLSVGLYAAMPASPADADFGLLPQVQIVAGFDAADSWVGWGDFWSWLSSAMQSIKSRISGGGSTCSGRWPA
mgnify:CR=1 FL=1